MAEQNCGERGRKGRAGRGRRGEPEAEDRANHRDERDLEIAENRRRIRELERDLEFAENYKKIRKLERLLEEARLDAGDTESFLMTKNRSEPPRVVPEGDEEDAEFKTTSTIDGNTEEDFIDWKFREPVYDEYKEDFIDWQPTKPIYDDEEEETEQRESVEEDYQADDSKLSERTVSDELPHVSVKLEEEVGIGANVSAIEATSNGTADGGMVEVSITTDHKKTKGRKNISQAGNDKDAVILMKGHSKDAEINPRLLLLQLLSPLLLLHQPLLVAHQILFVPKGDDHRDQSQLQNKVLLMS